MLSVLGGRLRKDSPHHPGLPLLRTHLQILNSHTALEEAGLTPAGLAEERDSRRKEASRRGGKTLRAPPVSPLSSPLSEEGVWKDGVYLYLAHPLPAALFLHLLSQALLMQGGGGLCLAQKEGGGWGEGIYISGRRAPPRACLMPELSSLTTSPRLVPHQDVPLWKEKPKSSLYHACARLCSAFKGERERRRREGRRKGSVIVWASL